MNWNRKEPSIVNYVDEGAVPRADAEARSA
jgi:hypothetical protein